MTMSSPTHKNLSSLIEQPDSRRRENGDNNTEVRIYVAEYEVCKAAQKARNTVGTGDLTGYLIRSSVVEPIRGLAARLIDTWVAGGDDADPETNPLPADEVSVVATNQAPSIERHPKYISLTPDVLKLVDDACKAPNAPTRAQVYAQLNATAKELVDLIMGGHQTFYLATLRYTWSTHYYSAPNSYRGGWVEAPGGPLAGYFVGSISWLREADDLQQQDGIWRLTRNWLGGSHGNWSNKIYPV